VRNFFLIILFLVITIQLLGQLGQVKNDPLFPIVEGKKWGMMNANGKIIITPRYDAIGTFKEFGYAVMEQHGRIGLLNHYGKEILAPKYDDIKVLDSLLFGVMEKTDWKVIDKQGKIILDNDYDQVKIWDSQFICFKIGKKWGIANFEGQIISPPNYDSIEFLEKKYFKTYAKNKIGLLSKTGTQILPPESDEINIYNSDLLFYKKNKKWGAVNKLGQVLIPPSFQSFAELGENFIKLISNHRVYLYSTVNRKLITQGEYDTYFTFSPKKILVKKGTKLGLINDFGNILLPLKFDEIQIFTNDLYRVKNDGKWGVVGINEQTIIPFEYDYIAPAKSQLCVLKKNGKLGVANIEGALQIQPKYDKIFIEKNKIRAFEGEVFTILNFDENGILRGEDQFENHVTLKIGGKKHLDEEPLSVELSDYQMEEFEWYFDAKQDKWGLRKLVDGSIHIEPVFDWVRIERNINVTLVGIEKWTKNTLSSTSYRFDMVFGLVDNSNGLLVTPLELLDIRLSDFHNGYPAARVVFENGMHGLVGKNGAYLVKDYAFIDEFQNGLARMSMVGNLSGQLNQTVFGLGKVKNYLQNLLSPSYMTDFTQHDQDFRDDANLICKECVWGYIDTVGNVAVAPKFSFAEKMINGVGFVEQDGKKGAIDSKGEFILNCTYDDLEFLENTQNQIFKVFQSSSKFGLIDTLAQIRIDLKYNKIGDYSEERLAVSENGLWGFTDLEGNEIIKCRYRKVQKFQEGLAAVQLGNKWGFINLDGEIVIEFKYRRVGNFKSGLAWVTTSDGVAYINPKDEKVIRPKFSKAYDFEDNVARVVVDGKYGLINMEGDFFLRPKYKSISKFNKYGVAIVQIGKSKIRYSLITRTGDLIGEKKFKKINPFSEGLAGVYYQGKWGFIDSKGNIIIENKYSMIAPFSEGLAAVRMDGKSGYINQVGEVVIPLKYSKCLNFQNGKALVFKGMPNGGVIDKTGKEIYKPVHRGLVGYSNRRGLIKSNDSNYYFINEEAKFYEGYYDFAKSFEYGIAIVKKNGKWGIINQNGMQVISPKYDKIEPYENGYAKVRINGFTGLTNIEGETIVPAQYELVSYAGNGLYRVEQGNKLGYFDSKGDWVRPLQN